MRALVRRRDGLALGAAALAWPAIGPRAQAPATRVAVVVGNAGYRSAPLRNAANDGRAMAKALHECGFEVVLAEEATRAQMSAAVARGRALLQGHSGVALFYFAGHGIQLDWRNYLLPVDAEPSNAAELRAQAIEVQTVFQAFVDAGSRMILVVLDACRDNPFGAAGNAKGFAPMEAPPRTYLAYATAPGHVAEDGSTADGHSLFTKHLLQELRSPQTRLEDVFKRVRFQVRRATAGRQVPWDMSSLEEDFSFAEGVLPARRLEGTRRDEAFDRERAAWERIRGSADVADFYEFLQAHPNGYLAVAAQTRLEQLQRAQAAPPTPYRGPRYVVGDRTEADRIDGFSKRRTAITRVVTAVGPDGVSFNDDRPTVTQDGSIIREGETAFDPPIAQTPDDLAVGRRWRTAFMTRMPQRPAQRSYWDFHVSAIEPVTVAAGTFQAYRVEGRGESVGSGELLTFTLTRWIDVVSLLAVKTERMFRDRGGSLQAWDLFELRVMRRVAR